MGKKLIQKCLETWATADLLQLVLIEKTNDTEKTNDVPCFPSKEEAEVKKVEPGG